MRLLSEESPTPSTRTMSERPGSRMRGLAFPSDLKSIPEEAVKEGGEAASLTLRRGENATAIEIIGGSGDDSGSR